MAKKKKKGGIGFGMIALIIFAILIFVGLFVIIPVFVLGMPIQLVIIIIMVIGIIIAIIVVLAILMGKRDPPDLFEKNFTKISEGAKISCPRQMFGKAVWTQNKAYMGKIIGFGTVKNYIEKKSLMNHQEGKGERPECLEWIEHIFVLEQLGGFFSKIAPFLKTSITVRIKPELVPNLYAQTVTLSCNMIKPLDNSGFYAPVISPEYENATVRAIESEHYREHVWWQFGKQQEITERAFKVSPTAIQKKNATEGGLFDALNPFSKKGGDE